MSFVTKLVKSIDWLSTKVGEGISWLTTVLVIVVCYDVFTRYMLNKSVVAVMELEWHIFSLIFLIGAGYTLKENGHVRVDVFYTRFSDRGRAIIDFLGCIIFLIPFCILIIWASKNFVINSYMFNEGSPDPGGLPARYILKAAIPVGFFLLLLQSITLTLRSFMTIINKPIDLEEDSK